MFLVKNDFGKTNASALVRTSPQDLPLIAIRLSDATPEVLAAAVATLQAIRSDDVRKDSGVRTVQVFAKDRSLSRAGKAYVEWARGALQTAMATPARSIPKIGLARQSEILIPEFSK